MCNPVRTFHCTVRDSLGDAQLDVLEYIEPMMDRESVEPVPMPLSVLKKNEQRALRDGIGGDEYRFAEENGLNADQRLYLKLRDTDHATPQAGLYRRGIR